MTFVNKFIGDEKMLKDCVYKILMKPYFVFSGIFIVVILFIAGIPMIVERYFDLFIFILLALYAVFVFAVMPKVYIKRMKNADKIMYGEETPQAVVTVTDDDIFLDEGQNHIGYKLSGVKAFICKKSICALRLNTGGIVMINPDGFEVGTFEEFKAFIAAKEIKIK